MLPGHAAGCCKARDALLRRGHDEGCSHWSPVVEPRGHALVLDTYTAVAVRVPCIELAGVVDPLPAIKRHPERHLYRIAIDVVVQVAVTVELLPANLENSLAGKPRPTVV